MRLEYLVKQGHDLEAAMQALDKTRASDGQYSSGRAEAHLNAIASHEHG